MCSSVRRDMLYTGGLSFVALVMSKYLPSGHGFFVCEELPAGQKNPEGHGVVQLALPGTSFNQPAVQFVQAATDVAFIVDPKVPTGHGCFVRVL